MKNLARNADGKCGPLKNENPFDSDLIRIKRPTRESNVQAAPSYAR